MTSPRPKICTAAMSAESELSHLRQTIAVATGSWEEAEVARQFAQREANAVKQAMHQLSQQSQAAATDVSEDEEVAQHPPN